MANYRRVTYEDRCQIQAYLQVETSITDISIRLGKHKSTISREIRRNRRQDFYCASGATKKAKDRFRRCKKHKRLTEEIKFWVQKLVVQDLSPEQISGRLRKEKSISISHQTLYNYFNIRNNAFRFYLRRFDKRGAGRYRQRRRLVDSNRLNIGQRPESANLRKRIGDWERDTLYVANQKQILVCVDRKTRLTKLAKVVCKKSSSVSELTLKLLSSTGKKIYTITNDNGPEMRDGHNLEIPVYHCDPRTPQQRGTVENTIVYLDSTCIVKQTWRNYRNVPFKKSKTLST